MTDVYSLRLFDTELLTFSMQNVGLDGLSARILSVDTEKKHLRPLGLSLTDDGIIHWLKRRIIPKNREPFTTSPEFTTHGMLRKAWHFIPNDGIYLYKGGTEGAANAGREPYSEFYASQIASRMGLHHVHYDLVKWKGILASKCKLFTDINTAYIPIGQVVTRCGLKPCLDFYASISPDALDELKSMLVFDALIYNEDRHFGNFGVLLDSRTGKVTGAAPIFDNGVSLFNYAMPEEYENLDDYAKTRSNPYGIPYEVICREVMSTLQRTQLKRMIGFSFTRHELYNLPEKYLQAIERQLQVRVRELLSLPKS